ncbi:MULTISPECIES: GNAT family N-acetyltransferase [unclassified Arthrobacter]|uniref:GNAT family N-acetyltransferase n=1 Tax=unclassified Arthrobacter TaxID=235627 RepID=UPI001E501B94|nr:MULTISPECIES: GNAT family N-acetyltransferase [unclassified Arthrobacter]MCC9145804.1 GNAT family N-acetyltransferase [Arthrobacter sp. zg-Y919]MDK1277033.1 GNAT family N-acetyltransferase [Arthrobacter sp. zg.Y919]WIB03562.1 GNAT family N-acetyltransferase [Arthrobacter sp. zg-Y919]
MEIRPASLLNGSFRVRRAARDDVGPISGLLMADALGQRADREGNHALEPYLRAYDAIAADPANFLAAVEDSSGRIAGTLQLTLIPCLALGGTTRLQVEAVHVRADLRSNGLGAAMMDWAVAEGRRNGAGLVQLTSNAQRDSAHRFYKRLGFEASHIGFKRHLPPLPLPAETLPSGMFDF